MMQKIKKERIDFGFEFVVHAFSYVKIFFIFINTQHYY